jgi:drug/metabolite transporter (DMT)-like permease
MQDAACHRRLPVPPHRPLLAALWMTGSIVGFSLVAIAGRRLHPYLDTFEVMLWRSAVGIVAVVAVAVATGQMAQLRPRRLGLHAVRNAVHFAGQNLWLVALSLIPMAQLFALEFSYPIMVALSAPLFLGERLTPLRALSAVIGFAGILIVARPFGAQGLSLGLLAALGCSFGFAGAALLTKRMTRTMSVLHILFWLVAFQTLFGLICSALDGRVALPPAAALSWVLVIGLSGLGAHLGLTKALSLAPASVVVPLDFLRLPLIAVVGMTLFGEAIDLWVFIGGAVIFAGNWLNIWSESRRKRPIPAQLQQAPHPSSRDAASSNTND